MALPLKSSDSLSNLFGYIYMLLSLIFIKQIKINKTII